MYAWIARSEDEFLRQTSKFACCMRGRLKLGDFLLQDQLNFHFVGCAGEGTGHGPNESAEGNIFRTDKERRCLMNKSEVDQRIAERVHEMLDVFGSPDADVARLLCDRYPEKKTAFRIVPKAGATVSLSYGRLKERSVRLASGLTKLGLKPGDRIGTLMSKSEDYLVTLMAIWRLGAVYVPLFTAFAPPAIEMRLASSGAKLIVSDCAQRSKLEDLADALPGLRVAGSDYRPHGDLSLGDIEASGEPGGSAHVGGGDWPIIEVYTSGTTGKPKGVVVPLRGIAAFQAYAEFGLGLLPDDIFWNAADPGWAYGLYCGIIASLSVGVTSVIHGDKFTPEGTVDVLVRERVTNFTAAPTVYRSLRAHGIAEGQISLRCASSGGEPLTPDVNLWAPKALGTVVHDHYGQTEAGMLVNNHHHPALKRPITPGSMGHALPGWYMTVIDPDTHEPLEPGMPGILAADLTRSPLHWFQGYVAASEMNSERLSSDGRWYLTGDVAKYDDDGSFRFSSRSDDLIIMAGYRIGPFDVESVLSTHPAVREVAIVATPDAIRGEVIEAVVVLAQGFTPSDALSEELKQKVRADYGAHAYPRRVHYRDNLPKTPSGKIQRFVIRGELRSLKVPS
ncbi:AMP-binding protein [Bradyrhizobium sp. 186]|uniref:AMP-binding protein n=1 Tax=Bradyrhizobium sp. 186 TaxID=2782654 RepID=UPI00200118F0|nr:AMP-binding protein [Bradyrhizobium sp. 186]